MLGTILDFEVDDGKLVAAKLPLRGPVDAVFGSLGRGRSTDELVAARGRSEIQAAKSRKTWALPIPKALDRSDQRSFCDMASAAVG